MSFSDSDWTREIEAARARRRPPVAVRTAVAMALAGGITLGAAGATLLLYASGHLDTAPRSLPDVLPRSAGAAAPLEQPPASLPAAPAALAAAPAPSPSPTPPPSQPEAQANLEPSIPAPQPAVAAIKPSVDEVRRKERAWARWYQRPPSCEGNPSTDQLIECANHFIRSKREFDERWRAGML